jgi:hypothetical protein
MWGRRALATVCVHFIMASEFPSAAHDEQLSAATLTEPSFGTNGGRGLRELKRVSPDEYKMFQDLIATYVDKPRQEGDAAQAQIAALFGLKARAVNDALRVAWSKAGVDQSKRPQPRARQPLGQPTERRALRAVGARLLLAPHCHPGHLRRGRCWTCSCCWDVCARCRVAARQTWRSCTNILDRWRSFFLPCHPHLTHPHPSPHPTPQALLPHTHICHAMHMQQLGHLFEPHVLRLVRARA